MAFIEKGLTLRDNRLLTLAAQGKSGEEIGAALGISGERALLRVREILRSRDVWDDVEREKLLLHSLYDLKARLEDNIEAVLTDPKQVDQYRRTLELLANVLDKKRSRNNADLEKVGRAQGMLLIELVEAAYSHARRLLSEEYPDVDVKLVDRAFLDGLEVERARIDAEQ